MHASTWSGSGAPEPVSAPTVVITVLTFRRPQGLGLLLPALLAQAVTISPAATVLVVDNDPDGGARGQVAATEVDGRVATYLHEPTPGIATARNRGLDQARALGADAIVFIDDDEIPEPGWLAALVGHWRRSGADAVAGPVRPVYPEVVEPWFQEGGFFERPRRVTGHRLTGAATNNLLLDLRTLDRLGLTFDPAFGLTGGSDTMLTRAMSRVGARIEWCDEAMVSEEVSLARLSREWVLRRSFRTGNVWGRVELQLSQGGVTPRLSCRAELLARAVKRVGRGVARSVRGTIHQDLGNQARGSGDVAAGLGLAASVFGYTYTEYRRARS